MKKKNRGLSDAIYGTPVCKESFNDMKKMKKLLHFSSDKILKPFKEIEAESLKNGSILQASEKKPTMREFATGAHRDSGGKFDFVEYMSTLALGRYAEHMRKMAVKYGAGNWLKGIPVEEFEKSLRRHLWQYDVMKQTGIVVEPGVDHLASAMFNLMGLMHEQEIEKLKTSDTLCGYPIDKTNFKRNEKPSI